MQLISVLSLLPVLAFGSPAPLGTTSTTPQPTTSAAPKPTPMPKTGSKICAMTGSDVIVHRFPFVNSDNLGQLGEVRHKYAFLCRAVGDKVRGDDKWLMIDFQYGFVPNTYVEDSCLDGGDIQLPYCDV